MKGALRNRSPKTVNNFLSVLSVLLKTAVEWEVIDRMPGTIRLVKVSQSSAAFHDFVPTTGWWRRLVSQAPTPTSLFSLGEKQACGVAR